MKRHAPSSHFIVRLLLLLIALPFSVRSEEAPEVYASPLKDRPQICSESKGDGKLLRRDNNDALPSPTQQSTTTTTSSATDAITSSWSLIQSNDDLQSPAVSAAMMRALAEVDKRKSDRAQQAAALEATLAGWG
jgi:hypothetical protein